MTFSENENKYIIKCLEENKGNINETINFFEEKFHYKPSKYSIYRRREQAGIKVNKRKKKVCSESEKEIYEELYVGCKKDLTKMLLKLDSGISWNRFLKKCKEYKLGKIPRKIKNSRDSFSFDADMIYPSNNFSGSKRRAPS